MYHKDKTEKRGFLYKKKKEILMIFLIILFTLKQRHYMSR